MGLPVFEGTPAKGIGLAYMLGPTGGYPDRLPSGRSARRLAGRARLRPQPASSCSARCCSATRRLPLGFCCWLGTVDRLGQAGAAMTGGVYPFVLGDLVKLALAACLVSAGARLVRR